jgi:hypothetical protein
MAWTAGRDFGLANLRFNCDGSVTYFSAFCRRRRKPACTYSVGGSSCDEYNVLILVVGGGGSENEGGR